MIKHYNYLYGVYDAQVQFEVDTEKFTAEKAQELLDFFSWNYNKKADPIDEAMKKYALECFRLGYLEADENDVKRRMHNHEGFYPIDGTEGIMIKYFVPFQFEEAEIEGTITPINQTPKPNHEK